jgi:LysR family transcriptional regulator, cyn operon transcriptional activator
MQGTHMLDLRGLKFFVEVADRRNLTQAANALNISQPALSRQLQSLESELGIALFHRNAKRLVLTAEGADLLTRARALLLQAQELSARALAFRKHAQGHIRIAASPHTIESLLPTVLMAFRRDHANIETSLMEGANDTLVRYIQEGTADIAIAAPVEDDSLESQPLFWASLAALVPPGSPLAGLTSISVEQLSTQPLLSLRQGFLTRHLFDRACLQSGVQVRNILESDSAYSLIALAQAGYGCAVVSSTALAHAARHAIPITLNGATIRHTVSAVSRRDSRNSPWVGTFVQLLMQHLRESTIAPHLERHPALMEH